jgi:hypothetical protein
MANTPNTIPTKRLAATIDGSATLIKLNNILDWSGTTLTSAYLGDVLYAVLRDQDNTVIEIMQLDPTTIANNSTTGITILRRGLKFNGDLTTEVSANKLVWVKNQTIVEIGTDVPQIFQNFVNVTDDQSVAGVKTFSSFPVKSGSTTPTAAGEFATKAYADTIATGSATYDQNIISGTAGETLVSGDLVYFKMSDQRWWKTDADASATSLEVKLGVSQGPASAAAAVNILIGGLAKNFSGLTAGTAYFVSGTAGAVSSTRGTFARFVGRAVSTTSMFFDANSDIETMKQSMSQIYAASTTGNDTYVVTLVPVPAAYTNGMVVNFKPDTANTGAATLNVNGLGAKTIKKNFDQTLADNDIKANQIVTVVYESTTDTFQMQSQVANTAPPVVDIQVFSSPGTTSWTKPSGAKIVEVYVIGAGGAGGSGSNTNNCVGGGGGGYGRKSFNASGLSSTETVVVGAAGTNASNNTPGGSGGDSSFGTTTLLRAAGGGGGSGNMGPAAGGSANGDISYTGGNSGTSISGAGVDTATAPSPRGGGNGGYNGGVPATAAAGGAGGGFTTNYVKAGGAGGAAGVNAGGSPSSTSTDLFYGGSGGGGGGYNGNGTNTGGNGGTGGFPGGGGGGSCGTNNTGGSGGNGCVWVITYF